MTDVTRDELRDLRADLVQRLSDVKDDLTQSMASGFGGVHGRLDVLNGRTAKGETAVAELRVKIANLDREVFHRRKPATDGESEKRSITRRDVSMFVVGGGAILGLFELIQALMRGLP